ncbi:MAG: nucleoside monophosphate kinase [Acidobacteria bacterium]|nr:nucleoside monophosphate kinase [Acidobacteriota bacterium]MCB9397547.1 nucleoside monophosphate kinase [Acidobacteriota bacterium]
MRILIFGPNGSGKGTQSALLVNRFQVAHIESGAIFRDHAKRGTELGKEAKTYTDRGALVPDSITIPMILDRLNAADCAKGWILDGFPRNPSQAIALLDGLSKAGTPLDAVVEIQVDREIAKARLLGRRTCPAGHPNNLAIPGIQPVGEHEPYFCWKCGAELIGRSDDMDENAIDIRLNIYFDAENGTLAAVQRVHDWCKKSNTTYVTLDGSAKIDQVQAELCQGLGLT